MGCGPSKDHVTTVDGQQPTMKQQGDASLATPTATTDTKAPSDGSAPAGTSNPSDCKGKSAEKSKLSC
jgi:hypothetical protein